MCMEKGSLLRRFAFVVTFFYSQVCLPGGESIASGNGVETGADLADIPSFTIAVIPDTQIHTFSPGWFQGFVDNTHWIRANVIRKNIVFVTHLGDVVEGELAGLENLPTLGWLDQWQRGHVAISLLDAVNVLDGVSLPYSISLGNHDLLPRGDKSNGLDPLPGGGFRSFFGAARYENYKIGGINPFQWYGGSDVTQWNHYQIIQTGPYTYLHLNLELDPQDVNNDLGIPRIIGINDAIAWAQSVIDAHPGLPTIISTHKSLTDLSGQNNLIGYWGNGTDEFFGGERGNTGQIIWEGLVNNNPQVFMIINGHEHEGPYREDGEYHQVSTNAAGLSVFEILVNYQDYFNLLTGNDPYMRLMEFDPKSGQIRNKTFSPTFANFTSNPGNISDTFNNILDAFDAGLFIPILAGEQLLGAIAPFPLFPGDVAHTREEAAAVILNFFAVNSVEALESVEFSPYLTDADSQFEFDVGFDASGRPTLAQVVNMNIYPYRCFNMVTERRRIPVAILGGDNLLVEQLDPATLHLQGVSASDRVIIRDVGRSQKSTEVLIAPNCGAAIRDGVDDLLVFFDRERVEESIGDIDSDTVMTVRLVGNYKAEFGGSPIVAEDRVFVKD